MKFFQSLLLVLVAGAQIQAHEKPHIVLVMADDMGWGQTSYYDHPVLKTPNLDAMAAHGLRFDRFYAGAPNCSPTRATVMTGRTNDRTGVQNHGYPLRLQEVTIAQILKVAGYATGHFGKWHLNGMRGPGAPIFASDERNPGAFGFDTWLSVTNFFDRNPILSRNGEFEEFKGDSSVIAVAEALKFIEKQVKAGKPTFTVIWYGTPHSPFMASKEDASHFSELDGSSRDHYGELVAMDRSIGALRKKLRDLKIADNTLFMFNSDNGGLPRIKPETVGGLRGFKGSVFEGGLRVPAVIEWPHGIEQARITNYPACTMDILPTLLEVAGAEKSAVKHHLDGISLVPVFSKEIGEREPAIGFRHTNRAAFIDNNWKLLTQKVGSGDYELYNLKEDQNETTNLIDQQPQIAKQMIAAFEAWNDSVNQSVAGKDYAAGKVTDEITQPRTWMQLEEYAPYLDEWKSRPEFQRYIK